MRIRALDGSHDFQFGKGTESYLRDNNAIAENIETRLLSFLNDCWFDLGAGIDWFRLLGTKSTKEEMLLNCRGIILQSYGVVRINTLVIHQTRRDIVLTYNVDTIFTQRFTQTLEGILNA